MSDNYEFAEDEEDYPTFDEVIDISRHMFRLAIEDIGPSVAQIAIEQIRASIREHFEKIGCDINDEAQLKAFTMGALFAVHSQMEYSQIGTVTAMIPAASINILIDPSPKYNMVTMESIARSLNVPKIEKKKPLRFSEILRIAFCGVKR